MTERALTAGYYTLKSVVIERLGDSGVPPVEIVLLVPKLSISSSIEKDYLSGYLDIIDTVKLLEGADETPPLRGEERIILTVMDTLENEITFDLFCYKIDNVQVSENNDMLTYRMHFISYQAFFAGKTRLIKPITGNLVSEEIRTIFEENYKIPNPLSFTQQEDEPDEAVKIYTNKDIKVEDTENVIRCTIPNLTPAEAINFLSNRTYSTTSPSCSFRFFENTRGFFFASDEKLLGVSTDSGNGFTTDRPPIKLTYLLTSSMAPTNLSNQMNNLITLSQIVKADTITNMYGGEYKNKVLLIDVQGMAVNLRDPGFEKNVTENDKHVRPFIDQFFTKEIQKVYLVLKDYDDTPTNVNASLPGNYHYDEIVSRRLSYRRQLDGVTLTATGPGRLDISAGDLIDLTVPVIENANENEGRKIQNNKQLSGKYIVKSVTHEMNMENMLNTYTLMKPEWSAREGDLLGNDEILAGVFV